MIKYHVEDATTGKFEDVAAYNVTFTAHHVVFSDMDGEITYAILATRVGSVIATDEAP